MNILQRILLGVIVLSVFGTLTVVSKSKSQNETKKQKKVVINNDNFIHADTSRAFLKQLAKQNNEVNKLVKDREFSNPDVQDVIRMNKDTLYSRVLLDVSEGATIKLPKYKGYQSALVLDINHSQIAVLEGEGELKITKKMLTKGDFVYVIFRTGVSRKDKFNLDYDYAHKQQDAIQIIAKSSKKFVPSVEYDYKKLKSFKEKLLIEFGKNPKKNVVKNGLGTMKERDPESARVVVALGWGGLGGDYAVYSSFSGQGEKQTITLDLPDLKYKEGAFFSITIYDDLGWIDTVNYAINSEDMTPNKDGTYTITILASGEPAEEGILNVVRSPRGRTWSGILRAYAPKNKDKVFAWADSWTSKMTKKFMK